MLHYAKAHACGNDFLIVEQEAVLPDARERSLATALCARTTGVGADGVEFLRWTGERAGTIRLRNADGGVAEISGNGTRCVAAWIAHRRDLRAGQSITLETDAGARVCTVVAREGSRMELRSGMGVPQFRWAAVVLDGMSIKGAVVSTGNPHFVVRVESPDFVYGGEDWQAIGRAICFHPDFAAQTNVEFVHVRAPGEIEIRIFERGVGPTSSSGTGTCASATAAIAFHGCERSLRVCAPGGMQRVEWPAFSAEMELTGPAELICEGAAFLDAVTGAGV